MSISPTAAPRADRTRAWRELALAGLLFALTWGALAQVARWQHREHTDETEWLAISILHWDQLVHGGDPAGAELDPPEWRGGGRWRSGVQRTMFGYPNPCLPKLVWGAVLHAGGHRSASPLVFDAFERLDPLAGREAERALEPAEPLARRVVLALASLSAVLVFLAGRAALPRPWGWACGGLALGLWIASPLVRGTATYLRTDYFMLPFALGALVLALHGRDALSGLRGERRQWLAGLALGVLCGLAVSSKLNGALTCACVALWVPLAWWRARDESGVGLLRGPLVTLLVAGAATCALFWALNPRLWSDPFGGVADILARWERIMRLFQDDWAPRAGTEVARSSGERVALFVDRTLRRDDPVLALTGVPLGAPLIVGGLAVLGLRALRPGSGRSLGASAHAAVALLVFVLVFGVGTALWLPIAWPRFWLPATPGVVLLESLCLVWLARLAWTRLRGPGASRDAP